MIVSSLMILAMIGYAVALTTPQQPTPDKMVEDKPTVATAQPAPEPVAAPPIVQEAAPAPTPAVVPAETRDPELPSRGKNRAEIYTVTAYDLSVESCGKPMGHPGYGKTATGYSLKGHSWDTARTIAVDPRFIPLGSKVLIKFMDKRFQQYNGVYTARDTGGAIKGHKIDLFLGDFGSDEANYEAISFGHPQAEVVVLEA